MLELRLQARRSTPLAATLLRSSALAVALAVPAWSQGTVFVVDIANGPGTDFVSLKTAMDTVESGDTLLVRAGEYDTPSGFDFVTNKGLEIIAEEGADVVLKSRVAVVAMKPDESFLLRGVRVDLPVFTIDNVSVQLINNIGPVWIEDCEITSAGALNPFDPVDVLYGEAVRVQNSDQVFLVGSTLRGHPGGFDQPAPGLGLYNSTAYVYDCSITGGRAASSLLIGPSGEPGVRLEGSTLFASGCTVTGGSGADQDGIWCNGGGGPGIHLVSGANEARLLDTTLAGGLAGIGSCNQADGVPSIVDAGTLTVIGGGARHFDASGPQGPGGVLQLSFGGQPGDLALLVAAGSVSLSEPVGTLGVLVGDPGLLLNFGPLPPTGELSLGLAAPTLGGGTALSIALQGVFVTGQDTFLGPASLATFYAE